MCKLKSQDLFFDVEIVISRFKFKFASRYNIEYYSFYDFRRDVNDVS